jgi:alkyl hydroperoxide reductase subunit AhpC
VDPRVIFFSSHHRQIIIFTKKVSNDMLTIGNKFPEFSLKAVIATNVKDVIVDIDHQAYRDKWRVFFFWPQDFSFICPTELVEFGQLYGEFLKRDAQIIGTSVDSEYVHLAWRKYREGLQNLPFPMLADVRRELSSALGILDVNEGVSQRATFIVDPQSIIRFVMVTDLTVGRNPQEVLRVLDALQTGELCPSNWSKGQKTQQMEF